MTPSDWLHLISPAVVIFVAGGLVQQIKGFRADLVDLKPMLLEWRAVITRLGQVEMVAAKLMSEHRQLRDKVHETREELKSIHDEE